MGAQVVVGFNVPGKRGRGNAGQIVSHLVFPALKTGAEE